jgi:hypothetical protein
VEELTEGTMRMWKALGLAIALLFALPLTALAADPAKLTGAVKTPLTLDEATLSALPATTVDISFATGQGTEKSTYTGVLVWDLLKKAELVNDTGKNSELRHTLLITADDGYAVAVAVGELDPSYGNKQVLLAYKDTDNGASFDHLRLLVPGDVHGGRAVKGVVSIEVK